MSNDDLFNAVNSIIDKEASLLSYISKEIWEKPELKFEELFAHDLLTDSLERNGFTVEKQFVLPTAFRAVYDSGRKGPTVAVICEYDALPSIGHACGHNLIAESGFGAGVAIQAVMKSHPKIPGKIVILGTPAEEGGGGKISLIQAGVFKDIDVALMVHPSPSDHLYPPFIGVGRMNVQYIGKEAHASGYPWAGINALDAAVACYNNIALLRQHIKPTCRIHGIISKGGDAANVIPGLTELSIMYRAASTKEIQDLKKRVESCINAAATATGCQVKITDDSENEYQNLITNKILADQYRKYAERLGVKFNDENPKVIPFMASSDMGNVSHVVPSIHPCYSIGTSAANHSQDFADAAGTPEAQRTTLIAAKSLALLALEVMCNKEFLTGAKEQFRKDLLEDAGL